MWIALLQGSLAPAAPPLLTEDTVVEIGRKWSGVESLSALVISQSTTTSHATPIQTETVEQYEYVNKGGRKRYRLESRTIRRIGAGEEITKTESVATIIGNDDTRYQVVEESGKKSRTMTHEGLPPALDVSALLRSVQRDNRIQVQPEQTVAGHPTYVIRATPRDSHAMEGWTDFCFAKESGVLLKSTTYDRYERVILERTVQSFKLNLEIPAERFKTGDWDGLSGEK